MIRRLEEQLRQLQAAKEELERRQNELQAMMTRLEETKVSTRGLVEKIMITMKI
jgi:prefoldin subunit 5